MAAHVGDHAAVVADLRLDGGRAQNLLVEHDRQPVVNVSAGKPREARGGVLGQHEVGLPASALAVLDRLSIAQVTPSYDRSARKNVKLVGRAVARAAAKNLRTQGKNAVLALHGLFPRSERAALDFVQFEHRGCLENLFDARGIVDARQRDQNLRFPARLHARFGQPEAIDLLFDRVDALRKCVRPNPQRFGGLHGQAVVGFVHRGHDPHRAEVIVHDHAEVARLGPRDTRDVDLNIAGVIEIGVVAVHIRERDGCLGKFVPEALDDRIGFQLESVLHLDLHDQDAAAAEIGAQPDIICPVRQQFRFRGGQADNAVDAYQDHSQDDQKPYFSVAGHIDLLLPCGYFFSSSAFSGFTMLATALRAICSLMLSGFTRTIKVSGATLTMVPTIPPVVTTSFPACNPASIEACCFFCRCIGMNTRK